MADLKILILGIPSPPFQSGLLIYNEMLRQGIDCKFIAAGAPERKLFHLLHQYRPHAVFVVGLRQPPQVYKRIRDMGIKVILKYADGWPPVAGKKFAAFWNSVIGCFDLICAEVRGMTEYLAHVAPTVWIPGWIDTSYYPVYPRQAKFDYDICFLGGGSDRRAIVNSLKKQQNIAILLSNSIRDSKVCQIYAGSKIALNLAINVPHFLDMDFATSNRLYNSMGLGAFCLTYSIHNLDLLFENGKHLVTYTSFDDMKEKIKYYLAHTDEREQIAKAGQQEVLLNHTLAVRVPQYVSQIKEIL